MTRQYASSHATSSPACRSACTPAAAARSPATLSLQASGQRGANGCAWRKRLAYDCPGCSKRLEPELPARRGLASGHVDRYQVEASARFQAVRTHHYEHSEVLVAAHGHWPGAVVPPVEQGSGAQLGQEVRLLRIRAVGDRAILTHAEPARSEADV